MAVPLRCRIFRKSKVRRTNVPGISSNNSKASFTGSDNDNKSEIDITDKLVLRKSKGTFALIS